jgi:hypothetical protein
MGWAKWVDSTTSEAPVITPVDHDDLPPETTTQEGWGGLIGRDIALEGLHERHYMCIEFWGGEHRRCGACDATTVRCVGIQYGANQAGKDARVEFVCDTCRRYTQHHYSD